MLEMLESHQKTKIAIMAMGCVTIIIAIGLATGHNGVMAATGMAAIVGVATGLLGFKVGKGE